MNFEIVGNIEHIEAIAVGGRIRDIMRLRRQFGDGRWRKLKGIARVRIAKPTTGPEYVLCVRNEECEDLEIRKVYRILPDKRAALDGYVRVIDESGEDYLYPESYFVPVRLPQKAQRAVAAIA